MFARLALAIGATWLAAAPAWADDPNVAIDSASAIETALNECLSQPEAEHTVAMLACYQAATAAWEKRMRDTYERALAAIDPASREALQASQQQWEAFRQAEAKAQNGPWRAKAGAVAFVLIANSQLEAVKERVAELRIYLPQE